MKKVKLNAFINILLFFSFLVSAISGLALWQALPRGGLRGGRGIIEKGLLLTMSRQDWIDIHNISSLLFVALAVIHLILHWNWIKNLPKFGKS